MTAATYHQSDFRGGEWSTVSQGRSEIPAYKTALAVSVNQILLEEGAVTRRSGTEWIGPTYGRTTAKLLGFKSTGALPYVMEFTNDNLQFYANTGYVCTNDRQVITASSSSGGVLDLTTTTNHGWSVGDTFILWFPAALSPAIGGPYRNRVFKATTAATNNLVLKDDLGNALPFDSSLNALAGSRVLRIFRFSTSWGTTALPNLRAVQAETQSVILSQTVAPQVLQITTQAVGDADPVFTLGAVTFTDGPYLDQQGTFDTPETGIVSAYTGSITFTPATTTFTAADVGRQIRLFSQPPAWNSGTTYTYGETVTYKGAYWTNIAAGSYVNLNVGVTPGTTATSGSVQVTVWASAPNEGQWAWGTITAQASTSCTVSLTTALNANNGTTIAIWRLGLFTASIFPTCGIYYEGRLGLAGAVPNRFDFSVSNDIFNFAPTDQYGTVLDSSAIDETLNSDELATIQWMAPDHLGVLMGTLGGEWLVAASTLNDPLTATSIQAHQVSKYGCANIEPKRAGMALIFVQRYTQRILEYLSDTFSGLFAGQHINEFAKHITAPGIVEIAYQEEKAPIIWACMADGSLAGTTYRRISHLVSEPPKIQGAHRHIIGSNARLVQSMTVQPGSTTISGNNLSDLLYVCTYAPGGTDYAVEVLRPIFEDA